MQIWGTLNNGWYNSRASNGNIRSETCFLNVQTFASRRAFHKSFFHWRLSVFKTILKFIKRKEAERKQLCAVIHQHLLHRLLATLNINSAQYNDIYKRPCFLLPVGMGEGRRRRPWHTMLRPSSAGASPIISVSSLNPLAPQRLPPSTASSTSRVPLWWRFIHRHCEGQVPPPSVSLLYRRGYVLKLWAKLQNKSNKIKQVIVTM